SERRPRLASAMAWLAGGAQPPSARWRSLSVEGRQDRATASAGGCRGRSDECCQHKRKASSLARLRTTSVAKVSRVQWRWEVILACASPCPGGGLPRLPRLRVAPIRNI